MTIPLALAAASMKRLFAYRVANWAGLFTNLWFLLFRSFALAAFYAGRPGAVAGYTAADVVAYVVVTQALIMVIPQWGKFGLGDSVRSGQIAIDLLRPVDYATVYLAQRMGESAYYALMRGAPIALVAWIAGLWSPPGDPVRIAAFVASVVLGAFVGHTLFLVFEALSFWLENDMGPRYLLMASLGLFGGLILPLSFFPAPLAEVARWLPFPSTLYAPSAILLGTESPAFLVHQLGWALGLFALARAVIAAGSRRLVLHGG